MAQPTTAPSSQNKGLVGAIMGIKDAGKQLLFGDEVQTQNRETALCNLMKRRLTKQSTTFTTWS